MNGSPSRIPRGKIAFWAGIVLALVICIPLSMIDGLQICRECGTTRRYGTLGWGVGGAWIHLPLGTSIRRTRALADFFGSSHAHVWNLNWEHMDGAFAWNVVVTGGHKIHGSGHINRLRSRYEEDGAFRDSLNKRIRSGEVTADQIRLLLSLSMGFRRHQSVPPGTHALVKKAGEWMGEYFWPLALEKDWPPEEQG